MNYYSKDGLGGWAAVLATTIGLRAFYLGYELVTSLPELLTQKLPDFLWLVGALQSALIGLTVWSLYLLFMRSSKFRGVFTFTMIIQLMWSMIIWQLCMIISTENAGMTKAIDNVAGTLIYGGVWIPYVYFSRRLKNRFAFISSDYGGQ